MSYKFTELLFKRKVHIVFIFLIGLQFYGQNPSISHDLPEVVPPSPTVASLMKFEEIPVNNYTGIPDISIPIFSTETMSKDVALNLSLNYHPASIAVEEVAGSTGLGWNLFAGGTISRTVRGLPDEINKNDNINNGRLLGIYHEDNKCTEVMESFPYNNWTNQQKQMLSKFLWDSYERDALDTQHDLYQFNFMGYTGRFYIKKTSMQQLQVISLDNNHSLNIRFNYSITTHPHKLYDFLGFTIYDDKGYKYIFDIKETTTQSDAQEHNYFAIGGYTSNLNEYQKNFINAFHLSKIYDQNEKLIIEFEYHSSIETVSDVTKINRTLHTNIDNLLTNGVSYTEYRKFLPKESAYVTTRLIDSKKINKINVVGKADIFLNYSQGREDHNLSPNSYKLDDIKIYNKIDTINYIKKISLEYEYKAITKSIHSGHNYSDDKRMFLNKVIESYSDSISHLSYEMLYKRVLREGQYAENRKDYWGYLTKSNTSSRETDPLFCTNDVLQTMSLPTGGKIVYNFEANTYSFIGSNPVINFDENPNNWNYSSNFLLDMGNISGFSSYYPLGSFPLDRYLTFEVPCDISSIEANAKFAIYESFTQNGNTNYIFKGNVICTNNNQEHQSVFDFLLEANKSYVIRYEWFNNGNETRNIKMFYQYKNKKPEQEQQKWLYGGGVRIKNITYYESSQELLQTPSKEKNYNYSFFNEVQKSSGSLVFGKPTYTYNESKQHFIELSDNLITVADWLIEASYSTLINVSNLLAQRTKGSDVGYKNVLVYETDNGKSQYVYTSPIDVPEDATAYVSTPPFFPSRNFDYKRGLLKNEKYYNQNENLLSEISYDYSYDENLEGAFTGLHLFSNGCPYSFKFTAYNHYIDMLNYCIPNPGATYRGIYCGHNCGDVINYVYYVFLKESYGWSKLREKKTQNYFYNDNTPSVVETTENFTYNELNKKISSHSVTNSLEETLRTDYFYDLNSNNRNRVGVVKKIESFRNNTKLETKEINYSNNFSENTSYLPESILVSKGTNTLESRIKYIRYDDYSNVLEVKQENGIHICYIYGYNKSQPIAKIENATYSQVESSVSSLQTLSNGTNESGLISALNNLRTNLPNALVTTYTYKPLVGVSTITDPRGYKTTYHYDSFGRLEFVKDEDGNILSENKYHYRTQN